MNDQWTKKFPTAADNGKWFFLKQETGSEFPHVTLVEVRVDERGRLYLCQPCNEGLEALSGGILMSLYEETNKRYKNTSFCGPITLPHDFAEIRKKFYASKEHQHRLNMALT